MAKKHDESIDIKRLSRVGVRTAIQPTATGTVKCLVITPALRDSIGIKSWGRVDFLVNYCGYRIISSVTSTETIINGYYSKENKTNYRDVKKKKKEHQLTDKTKVKKGKK